MTLYIVVTTLVTLGAVALAVTTTHYNRQNCREALDAMRDLLLEFSASESEMTRQDAREVRIRSLVDQLHKRMDNHSTRLNELEDLVDLLNHDCAPTIDQDVDEALTSELVAVNDEDRQAFEGASDAHISAIRLREAAALAGERLRRQEYAGWAARVQADIDLIDDGAAHADPVGVTTVVTVGEEFEIADLWGIVAAQQRAEHLFDTLDPVIDGAAYACAVRDLARHFHIDHVI